MKTLQKLLVPILVVFALLLNNTTDVIAQLSADAAKAERQAAALSRAQSAATKASTKVRGIWKPSMKQSYLVYKREHATSGQTSSESGPDILESELEAGSPQAWELSFGINTPNSVGAIGNVVTGNALFNVGLVGFSHWGTGVGASLSYNTKENLELGAAGNFRLGSDVRLEYISGLPNIAVITGGDGRRSPYTETESDQFSAPLGQFDKLTRDSATGKFTLEDTDRNKLIFTADGFPEEYQTRGNTASTTYTYTDLLLTRESDDTGRAIVYDYVDRRLRTVTDPEARVWTLDYDGNGQLWKVTYPPVDGQTYFLEFRYDPEGHLHWIKDLAGKIWEYGYHPDSKLAWHQTPEGVTERTTLEYLADRTEERLPLNQTSPFTYLINGEIVYGSVDEVGAQNTVEWNPDLNMLPSAATDGEANSIYMGWNTRGDMTDFVDQENHNSRLTYYEESSDLWQVFTPASGAVPESTYEYTADGSGNLENVKDYNGEVVASFVYNDDPRKSLQKVIDGEGREATINEYDAYGNVKQVTAPDGTVGSALYTGMGYITQATDALGTTVFTPDNWLRTRSSQRGTRLAQIAYDPEDRPISVINPRGFATTFEYDEAGRPTRTFRANGAVLETRYDLNGRVQEALNGNKEITSYTYNPDHTLRTLTRPDGVMKSWDIYDGNKNIKQFTHGGIGSWVYDYDKTGAMTYKFDPDGRTVTSGYDFPGNGQSRSWMQDWTGLYQEISNPATRTFTTVMPGNTVHKIMNKAGEVTRMTQEGRGDFVYTYDPVTSNLTSLLNPEGETTYFDYYTGAQGGMLWQQTFANGAYLTYPEYTIHGETQYYELYNNLNEVILSARMQYDNNGNRTHLEPSYNDRFGRGALILHQVEYDSIDQVIHEEFSAADPIQNTTSNYHYDLNGNRQAHEFWHAQTGISQVDYIYNRDRLFSALVTYQTGSPYQITYDYDSAGRVASIIEEYIPPIEDPELFEFRYDCDGRITKIDYRCNLFEPFFAEDNYNSLSQWVTRYRNDRGLTTYSYDGTRGVAPLLSAKNEEYGEYFWNYFYTPGISEFQTFYPDYTRAYYYGAQEQDYPFATTEDGTRNYPQPYFRDAFGNTRGGSFSGLNWDSPFGFHGGTGAQPFVEPDFQSDRVQQFVKMGSRYYDKFTGRFLQPDPSYGLGGEDNLYSALNNNPISFVDPMGTDSKKIDLLTKDKERVYTGMTKEPMARMSAPVNLPRTQMKTPELISAKELLRRQDPGRAAYESKRKTLMGVTRDDPLYRYAIEDEESFNLMVTILGGGAAVKGFGIVAKGVVGSNGPLFGRFGQGILNNNNFLRIGWGWKGSAKDGKLVFRLAWGKKGSRWSGHLP